MTIKLYSSDTCPKCKVLKMKLDKANIPYESITGDDAINAGIKSIPVLEVDGVRMHMVEANNWVKEYSNGN